MLVSQRQLADSDSTTSSSSGPDEDDAGPGGSAAAELPHFATKLLRVDPDLVTFRALPGARHAFEKPVMNIPQSDTLVNLREAAELLRINNTPVAFPTETVYGLGANVRRDDAVHRIFAVKNRPADNPLIVHVASLQQLQDLMRPKASYVAALADRGAEYADRALAAAAANWLPSVYWPLIERFWPGPLTIILPINRRATEISQLVTAGQATVGVRMPSHPVALALLLLSNTPLAAPSANRSTRPSPTSAAHVMQDLQGRIPCVLDGGPCRVGVESTVVDGTVDPPVILRPGGVSLEEIRACGGVWERVRVHRGPDGPPAQRESRAGAEPASASHTPDAAFVPRTPGMKYRHYSPRAKVVLAEGLSAGDVLAALQRHGVAIPTARHRVGALTARTWSAADAERAFARDPRDRVLVYAMGESGADISRTLFHGLRHLDEHESGVRDGGGEHVSGLDAIFVEGVPETDEGLAIMNRLRKAASVIVTPDGLTKNEMESI